MMDLRLIIEIYIGIGLFLSDPDDLNFSFRNILGTILGVLMFPAAQAFDLIWRLVKWVLDLFNIRFFWFFFLTKRYKTTDKSVYESLKNIRNKRRFVRRWTESLALWLIKKRNKF